MRTRRLPIAAAFISASMATPAAALCSYKGADNARTTIGEEFADARWVVRARVISAVDGVVEQGKPDAGMAWTSYRLAVVHSYKGPAPNRLKFYTERNSGGFYMGRAWMPLPAGHDVGSDYLLFLNPIPAYRGRPAAAVGAAFVNYSCGQSKRWSVVPNSSRRFLEQLSRRR